MRLLTCFVLSLTLLPRATSADITVAGQRRAVFLRTPRPSDPPVRYVIITDSALQGAFMRLAPVRAGLGTKAGLVTLQAIESGYPAGVDLAERVRLFLRDAHANWGTQYVLLGGDASVVPIRQVRLRLGPVLGDIDFPTDQYYACLDGSWNADGDALWGENPGPGEPGDDVDFFPELFVGRAPVRNVKEAVAFVRRTLDYEDRLATQAPRSALLAAELLGSTPVDLAGEAELLRPALETTPGRSIQRLYENSAAWPGSLPESRTALLNALDAGVDLAVLLGACGPGRQFLAGQDPVDRVTSDDLLGLTNAPHCPIAYFISGFTTAPGDPLSIGNALLQSRNGGAVAVLGSVDNQYIAVAGIFMDQFFDRALGGTATPIGEALAGTIAAAHAEQQGDSYRLTSQGTMLLGDPALRIDPSLPGVGPVASRAHVSTRVWPSPDEIAPGALVIASRANESSRIGTPVVTGNGDKVESLSRLVRLGLPVPNLARTATTIRFEFPTDAAGPYAIDVFDPSGRRVRALTNGTAAPGRFEFRWDLRSDKGASVPAGVYFLRLQFAGTSIARRVFVLR